MSEGEEKARLRDLSKRVFRGEHKPRGDEEYLRFLLDDSTEVAEPPTMAEVGLWEARQSARISKLHKWNDRVRELQARREELMESIEVQPPVQALMLPQQFWEFAIKEEERLWVDWKRLLETNPPCIRLDKRSRKLLGKRKHERTPAHKGFKQGYCHFNLSSFATFYHPWPDMRFKLLAGFERMNDKLKLLPVVVFPDEDHDDYKKFLKHLSIRHVKNMRSAFKYRNLELDEWIGLNLDEVRPVYEVLSKKAEGKRKYEVFSQQASSSNRN